MTYRTTPIAVSVHGDTDSPIYGESAVHVLIDDETAGPFITLRQVGNDDPKPGMVGMDIEQLEIVTRVARELIDAQPKEMES